MRLPFRKPGVRNSPLTRHNHALSESGLTRIEVAAILACVFLVAAFMLLPALSKAKAKPSHGSCQNYLKQISISYITWAQDFGNRYPMSIPVTAGGTLESQVGSNMFRHLAVMSNILSNPRLLVCPSDDRQSAQDFAHMSNQNISYFIGLDADESRPTMWLAGDRNLVTNDKPVAPGLVVITDKDRLAWSQKMHNGAGNILLSDGSVRSTKSSDLEHLARDTGTNPIRLAVP